MKQKQKTKLDPEKFARSVAWNRNKLGSPVRVKKEKESSYRYRKVLTVLER
jgi:hypothetical protein